MSDSFLMQIRALVMSNSSAALKVFRKANGAPDQIARILNDEGDLTQCLKNSTRLTRDEVERLISMMPAPKDGIHKKANAEEVHRIQMAGYVANRERY